MKWAVLLVGVTLVLGCGATGPVPIDSDPAPVVVDEWTFDELFPPAKQRNMGIQKLTPSEKAELKSHVESLLMAAMQAAVAQTAPVQRKAPVAPKGGVLVYITKIAEDKDDVLRLDNGGIVEIPQGFLGFVGFRKDAVLFKNGAAWKIWIEGKKTFKCNMLKAPTIRASGTGEKAYILKVEGDGKILTMLDGSIYEVGDLHIITTSLWLGNSDALLIDGVRLLNLDEGGKIIDVTKLK